MRPGDINLELAARHYYGADDRLMAVERYSYRSSAFQDGTWEEYWYDALGRRVLTRTRREPTSPYDATVSGPLCVSSTAPICRSFTERVWWDGDQSLVEERTPEGTSDVSNSGTVGNIHALVLDEPLAVITTSPSAETRIINYNWRGQGMGSVYPSGHGADVSTGFAIAAIDWPASTQAQTYFTPSLDAAATDNNPKKWLGTFIQNGMGTTGMLYRRNRYFDTNTGRFTQEDPIGIAGGVNQYGFANGDPVNFSDPFGLCPAGDWKCELAKALYEITGAVIGGFAGFTGGAATGALCGPFVELCSPVMAATGAISLSGASAVAAGKAIDSYYDGLSQMTGSGKGSEFRGGKQNQRDPDHARLMKEFNPTREERTRIHEEIAKQKKGGDLNYDDLRQIFMDIVRKRQ